jgi:hypothetical protein
MELLIDDEIFAVEKLHGEHNEREYSQGPQH